MKGATVTIASWNEEKLKKAAKEIDSTGNLVQYFVLDVAKASVTEIEEVVKKAEKKHGPINTLINNAGISRPGMIFESDALANAQENMELNYFANVKMVSVVGKKMVERKKGRIVFVGSVCSYSCIPGLGGYQASKYAQWAFSDSIRYECEVNGIKVHLFTPSTIDTPGLVVENQNKHPVTWKLESMSTKVSADDAANSLIRGMENGEYII